MTTLPMFAPLGSQLRVLCLMIWVTVCMSLQLRDKDSGFISNKFVAHPGKRLALPISQAEDNNQSIVQKSVLVDDVMDCSFECLTEGWCHSVNVRLTATKSGRHVCELISTDRYNHSEYLVQDKDFVHFGIKSPCEEYPCSNGECLTLYDEPYFYCACSLGYTGLTCSADIDECCTNQTSCDPNARCRNTIGSYTCTCNAGYHGDGKQCTDIDECSTNPRSCDPNARCKNTIGSYTCTCNAGYHGDGKRCTDIDECRLGISGCGSNAYCTNSVGSYVCTCRHSGYYWTGSGCAANQIRLSHGSYGRVEVLHNGQWGTVCDDHWTINEGRVVCRWLGYGSVVSVHQAAHYGQGSGPIWLDEVHCSGNEATLFSCQFIHRPHNCGHSEDASVVCS
ncbi:signal peptide, CUB and EGF-like domain-containing protein 3 isoform X2 [Nematostella vectensis]|uniref:signal peptide, CUB and EGF-like domain-containing protein 3 isoform X2 n=1 Tax=Nematostella vectensis TaxID=45351 RepID=UPI00138FF626|nr:signal peptide, CUB and EGF-like domain-containing protein 3 isoform X2 [Nematostella vectensis]